MEQSHQQIAVILPLRTTVAEALRSSLRASGAVEKAVLEDLVVEDGDRHPSLGLYLSDPVRLGRYSQKVILGEAIGLHPLDSQRLPMAHGAGIG